MNTTGVMELTEAALRHTAAGSLEPELERELARIGLAAEFGSPAVATNHLDHVAQVAATNRAVSQELGAGWERTTAEPDFVDRLRGGCRSC